MKVLEVFATITVLTLVWCAVMTVVMSTLFAVFGQWAFFVVAAPVVWAWLGAPTLRPAS